MRRGAKHVLNMLKWHPEHRFEEYVILVVHRGAPNNRVELSLEGVELGKSGVILPGDVEIPYHRILEVRRKDGVKIWGKQG